MSRQDTAQLALALALTATAGWVDAVGFLALGQVFVSFMSGDTTRLAVAAAAWNGPAAARLGGLVLLFVAGVALGRVLARAAGRRRRPAVLGAEAALLTVAALAPGRRAALVVMVLAMGAQNAILHRAGDTTTSLTYVTGTLVRFAERLVDALWPGGDWGRWNWTPYLLQWTALLAGAVGGGLAFGALDLRALAIPVAALGALVVLTWGTERPGRSL
jgi:uncharacterized membrane protein YoaK (UPF0700 family)